jgi:hypothetical protein
MAVTDPAKPPNLFTDSMAARQQTARAPAPATIAVAWLAAEPAPVAALVTARLARATEGAAAKELTDGSEGAHQGAAGHTFRCQDHQRGHVTETRPPWIYLTFLEDLDRDRGELVGCCHPEL